MCECGCELQNASQIATGSFLASLVSHCVTNQQEKVLMASCKMDGSVSLAKNEREKKCKCDFTCNFASLSLCQPHVSKESVY